VFGNGFFLPFGNYGGIVSRNDESAYLLLEPAEQLRRPLGAESEIVSLVKLEKFSER
jgi:hypothetical protein